LIMLAACNSTTNLSGFVDPNYRGNYQTKNILVMGFGIPIDEQKALESTLKQSLVNYDVQVIQGLEVFPPTRDFSETDIFQIANSKGADSLLIVSVDDRDVTETYSNPVYIPGNSTSYVSGFGNSLTVKTYTSPGYTIGGGTIRKPHMSISVYLINIKNQETIWTAEGISRGNKYASFYDLTVNVAKTTVEELSKEGLIATKVVQENDTKVL